MARRTLDGQLNMFDFWNQLITPAAGEDVQMVSLMPECAGGETESEEPEAAGNVESDMPQPDVAGSAEDDSLQLDAAENAEGDMPQPDVAGSVEDDVSQTEAAENAMPDEVEQTEPDEDTEGAEAGAGAPQTNVVKHATAAGNAQKEREIVEAGKPADPADAPVMHKEARGKDGAITASVSFYNYNRICVLRQNEAPVWKNFDNAKDAVDFYIEEMLKL